MTDFCWNQINRLIAHALQRLPDECLQAFLFVPDKVRANLASK